MSFAACKIYESAIKSHVFFACTITMECQCGGGEATVRAGFSHPQGCVDRLSQGDVRGGEWLVKTSQTET